MAGVAATRALSLALGLSTVSTFAACAGDDGDAPDAGSPELTLRVDLEALPYDRLSEYGFFRGALRELAPATELQPFEPVSPLWSDHAAKQRLLFVPDGEQLGFAADDDWDVPVGSVAIKSFFFPDDARDPDGPFDPIETRLLVRTAVGFDAYVYLWNDERSDAELLLPGRRVSVEYVDARGERVSHPYQVPNQNQCGSCHERDDVMRLLGVNTRQLARAPREGEPSALQRLSKARLVDAGPTDAGDLGALEPPAGDGPLDARARSWLEANCAHCHQPGGGGGRSGLVLLASERERVRYGVCKAPVAAGPGAGGLEYDIVPGDPERSIFVHRMESSDPEIRMPELPVLSPDPFGTALVREWIAAMEPRGCEP
jgi:uncharacterized repeat protein (TIGR03806 family)